MTDLPNILKAALLAALLILAPTAHAKELIIANGHDLYRNCSVDRESVGGGDLAEGIKIVACLNFLHGARETHDAVVLAQGARAEMTGRQPAGPSIALFCQPRTTSLEQVRLIVLKWLRDNAATWAQGAADHVLFAVMRAFPCRR